ncbi:MAG: DUF5667 domain-containing protein [Candidatus Spechtbacterales bacterium]|nr:DUF5667 domain-containing protein [Candidatus Spechtbacterales bacterium]
MENKDLLKQLESLKEIKPKEDWATSARESLISHIDNSIESSSQNLINDSSYFARNWETLKDNFAVVMSHAKIATAGTLALFLGIIGGVFVAQDSVPGSALYPVKIASEDVHQIVSRDKASLRASFAVERFDEAAKLATTKLSEEDAEEVSQKLEEYKNNIEEAKTSSTEEDLDVAVEVAKQDAEALTSIISESNDSVTLADNLRNKTEGHLANCEDEKLSTEISELLEEGGLSALIDAHLLALKCKDVPPAQADNGLDNATDDKPAQDSASEDTETTTDNNEETQDSEEE